MLKAISRTRLALGLEWIWGHHPSWCRNNVFPELLFDLLILFIPGNDQLFFITAFSLFYRVYYVFAIRNNFPTPPVTDNDTLTYALLYYQIPMYVGSLDKWFLSYLATPLYAVVVVALTAVLCKLECYHGTVAFWFFVASNVLGMDKKLRQSLREAKDFVTREGITKTIACVVIPICWFLIVIYEDETGTCRLSLRSSPLFAFVPTIRTFLSMIKIYELLLYLPWYFLFVDVALNMANGIPKAFLNWLPSRGTVNLQNAAREGHTEVRENHSIELVFGLFFINFFCATSLSKSNNKSVIFYTTLLLCNFYTAFRKRAERFYEEQLERCNALESSQRRFWDHASTGLLLTCLFSAEVIFAIGGKIIKISISSISEWSQELRVLEIAKFKNSFHFFLALNIIDHFCLPPTSPTNGVRYMYFFEYHCALLIYKCFSIGWNEVTSLCSKHLLKNLSESSHTQRIVQAYVKSIVLLVFLVCASSWTSWRITKSHLLTDVEKFAFLLMNFIQLVQPLNDLVKFTLSMYYNDHLTTQWSDKQDLMSGYLKLFCEILIFFSALVRGSHEIKDVIGISMFFYWRIYTVARNLWRERQCPICFDLVSDSPDTQCGHYYHYECLHQWLANSNTCPLCRSLIAAGF